MNKKYSLIKKDFVLNGNIKLYRIKAKKSFGDIIKGEFGGYIQSELNLSEHGNAWVYGNARVSGNALVFGNAWVSGNAWVFGNAQVFGSAHVYDSARVFDSAQVFGSARVFGNARVYDSARVHDSARVYGNAWVSGSALVYGNEEVTSKIKFLYFDKYDINISDTHLRIGCKSYTFNEWEKFSDKEISKMDYGALEWWNKYKPIFVMLGVLK